jgi:hypothetical protein
MHLLKATNVQALAASTMAGAHGVNYPIHPSTRQKRMGGQTDENPPLGCNGAPVNVALAKGTRSAISSSRRAI